MLGPLESYCNPKTRNIFPPVSIVLSFKPLKRLAFVAITFLEILNPFSVCSVVFHILFHLNISATNQNKNETLSILSYYG
jgi:hypothetical protein